MSNRILASAAVVSFGVLAAASGAASATESRCANPRDFIDAKACAALAAGPEALVRFIERTRMVYGLYIWDYATPAR